MLSSNARIAAALIALGDKAPRVALVTTGAGAGAQAHLWGPPGGSNFFVGAEMPYLQREIDRVLGFTPERYCSAETAVDLAITAYLRASEPGKVAIGIGCTGKVASVEAHKGPHKIFVAVISPAGCFLLGSEIPKGAGPASRAIDGQIADAMILDALRIAAHVDETPTYPVRDTRGEPMKIRVNIQDCTALVRERILARPFFTAQGKREPGDLATIVPEQTAFYPGSFNPPHAGHLGAAENAQAELARRGWRRRLIFATCITPPHKPVLTVTDMLDRAAQMRGRDFLLTEGDPLFVDKARRNRGAFFLLGADVFASMLDPSWGIEPGDLLAEYQGLGTRFLVVGRLYRGRFLTLDDLLFGGETTAIHARYHSLFLPVPGRWDMSSSGREPGTDATTG